MDERTIRDMCELTRSNMAVIIPSDSDRQADDVAWREAFDRNTALGIRHVVERRAGELVGFLSWTTPPTGDVYINELQIRPDRMRNGVTLRRLLGGFARDIADVPARRVRTYTNRRNAAAQRLLPRLGFVLESETANGFRYAVDKQTLLDRLKGW